MFTPSRASSTFPPRRSAFGYATFSFRTARPGGRSGFRVALYVVFDPLIRTRGPLPLRVTTVGRYAFSTRGLVSADQNRPNPTSLQLFRRTMVWYRFNLSLFDLYRAPSTVSKNFGRRFSVPVEYDATIVQNIRTRVLPHPVPVNAP